MIQNRTLVTWGFALLIAVRVVAAAEEIPAAKEPSAKEPAPNAATLGDQKHPLHQIVVAESVEAAERLQPAPGAGFLVVAPTLAGIDRNELYKLVGGGENKLITDQLLVAVANSIEAYAHQKNYPHALVMIPAQNISSGTVRIALVLNPPLLHHIVLGLGTEDAMRQSPRAADGFLTISPALSFVDRKDLTARLAQSENQLFQDKLIAAIAQVVEIYVRQHDYPIATAVIPPQNASDGTLHVAIELGKIRKITMAGNRWFSDSLLRDKLHIAPGGTLKFSNLDNAISWTNNNPFRRVRVAISPVAGSGEADLIVAVQEALPFRAGVSVDNGGNDLIGNTRFTGSAAYANLWGLDHQVSYQFVTTNLGPNTFEAHGVDYRLPLRGQDSLAVSGSYVRAQPSLIEGLLTQKGESLTTNVRYTHPLRTGDNPAEVYGAFDFKQSNNNLLFWADQNTSIPALTNKTDVFQFSVGGSAIRRDKRGAWAFGGSVTWSPGRINSLNSETAYFDTRALAKPRYTYGQLTFQRLLNLSRGWDFTSRGVAQIADGNLLPSEQLFIGGASTVRGFRENVFGGDEGFLLTNELLAPKWNKKLPLLPKNRNTLETRLLTFYDVGHVRTREETNLDPKFAPLASAGVGLRMNLATNFSLSADYGWQITRLPYAHDDHGRGHIKVTLAF